MATGRSSFAKRQRDMAKKARAEAKRQKRLDRNSSHPLDEHNDDDGAKPATIGPVLSNAEIVAKVEELHRRYDDGLLDLDTFDEQKTLLMAQISI